MVEPMYLTSLTLLGGLKYLGQGVCENILIPQSRGASFLPSCSIGIFFKIFNGEEAKHCKWVDTWCTACTSLTRTRKRESEKTLSTEDNSWIYVQVLTATSPPCMPHLNYSLSSIQFPSSPSVRTRTWHFWSYTPLSSSCFLSLEEKEDLVVLETALFGRWYMVFFDERLVCLNFVGFFPILLQTILLILQMPVNAILTWIFLFHCPCNWGSTYFARLFFFPPAYFQHTIR